MPDHATPPPPHPPNTPTTPTPTATHDEIVPVLDFGGQTAQLICRRIRDAGVFSVLVRPDISAEELGAMNPKAIVLSGGPASVDDENAPTMDPIVLDLGVPVLGICYGMQLAARIMGATVGRDTHREFGRATLEVGAIDGSPAGLLEAIPQQTQIWMSHGDQVSDLAQAGLEVIGSTATCPYAAVRSTARGRRFYGVQFHPEVTHTTHGPDLFRNFLYGIAQCQGAWSMANYAEEEIERVRERVGDRNVICGLSGGVDSSVVAALLHKAIGDRLHCVFVDNGLLRKNERDLVEHTFRDHFKINLRVADASAEFLADLAGVEDPQLKRTRIGHRFIEVFKEAANEIEGVHFLAQGTLYPDVIESGHGHSGHAANIKLHHNVGGLPEELGFELIEPLRELFKDEARKLGAVLGLPESLIWRHPFPGPGLAVRVLGEVTEDRLAILRDCDEILLEEITSADLYRKTSQVFAVLLPVKSVGVMGDGRTYENVVAVRAVESEDFMSADWCKLPYEVLGRISNRLINEVRGVNRVVYDISSKPPATIEWE